MQRAVFMDRDGVIVIPEFRDGRSFAPQSLEKFRLYDDAEKSVQDLKAAKFIVIVVTNQPDVGRGLVKVEIVEAMHEFLSKLLLIDDIEVCYHTHLDNCQRRKPLPGMLKDAMHKWGIDASQSFMIGDRLSDILAGKAAGCRTIFINRGYTTEPPVVDCDAEFSNLSATVSWILDACQSRVGM